MEKKNFLFVLAILVVVTIAISSLITAYPSDLIYTLGKGGKPTEKPTKECNDGIDNDGDNQIDWPNDTGCGNKNDNDESDCGDGVCEGEETQENCPEDCGAPTTTTTTTSTTTTSIPDSCTDTDGGIVLTIQGTVSGYSGGSPYSYTDLCIENSTTLIREYYCWNDEFKSLWDDCSLNYTACSNGACV